MRKIIFFTLIALVLSACGNRVHVRHIDKAVELCENNGGLFYLDIWQEDNAVCKNGAEFTREEWMLRRPPK